VVVGDFDADGATSTALSVLSLRALGCDNVTYLVPNRFEDGYGLSPEVVDQAHARGAQMIMTVDNGIFPCGRRSCSRAGDPGAGHRSPPAG
jgi:single-stranded-DNA-specific exonuclease